MGLKVNDGICYIVGAADCTLSFSPASEDMVIAADGGYDRLSKAGIEPTVLIGDMDSIRELPQDIELKKFKVEKNETDTHLSLLEGEERGYKKFMIFGGVGGREDHTLANLSLLLFARRKGLFARLISEDGEFFVIENEKISIPCGEYRGVSIFAFGGNADGVSIKGLKYEADNITLTPDFPLGVSNSFAEKPAEIEVGRGALLVMLRKDK